MWRAPCGYCGCNLVQELPIAYKPVPSYRLPLTRTARPVVVPYDRRTHPTAGRSRLGAAVLLQTAPEVPLRMTQMMRTADFISGLLTGIVPCAIIES